MKILQIIQKPQFRGAEIFACQLSVELIRLGHEVEVLFLTGSAAETLPFPLSFLHLKANLKNRFWDFKAYQKLSEIIKNGQFDIVQANAADTLKYAAISKVLFRWNAKLVFRNANKMGDFLNNKPKKILNTFFVRQVDLVASVSELCKEDFVTQFPFFKKPVMFLPIGVDVTQVVPYHSFSEIGFPFSGCNVFVHVGSFVPEKNHIGLLSIFQQYLKYDPKAKLLLIGEGKLKADISRRVADNLLQENIFLLGKRDDVLKILPLCKALLMPSHIEGLPGVILEAMILKIPVIAYNVGGIGEVVIHKETGFQTEHNNENEFISMMKYLGNTDIEKIIVAAHTLVRKQYDNFIIAKSFEDAYTKIVLH